MPFMDGGIKEKKRIQVSALKTAVNTINASVKNISNSLATMDGQQWRVVDIQDGTASVRMELEEV
jgi:hypothetical protein